MPPAAVYVGRPTKWGNPYWHEERFHGRKWALSLYGNTARGVWSPALVARVTDGYARQIYRAHTAWLKGIGGHPAEMAVAELAGKDLACWCPLVDEFGQSVECHADVLLRIANGGGS